MRTIYKYALMFGRQLVSVPDGGIPLSFQMQGATPTVWFLVDQNALSYSRRFTIYGTGWVMPDKPGTYIGTAQADGFVWHLFEGGDE